MTGVKRVVIKRKITILDAKGVKKMNLNIKSLLAAVNESEEDEILFSIDTKEIGSDGKKKIAFNNLMDTWNINEIERGEYKLTRKEGTPAIVDDIGIETPAIVDDMGVETPAIVDDIGIETPAIVDDIGIETPAIVDDMGVEETPVVVEKIISKKRVEIVVALCRGVTVKSVDEALKLLKKKEYTGIETREKLFQDKITSTFKKGSVKGQVTKLFSILYAHGVDQTRGKLTGYVEYLKEEKMYQDFNRNYEEGVDPMTIAISRTRADLVYFKYVVIRKMVEGLT